MRDRSLWQVARAAAIALAAAFILASPAGAQEQLTPQQFQANPGQLLTMFPAGGPQMISLIRQLTMADPADLQPIIGLLATANDTQATAIGTGLGQAAQALLTSNPAYANQIQALLATANNGTANAAYAAVTGQAPTAAAGGGGGGGGGGAGGGGGPIGGFSGSSTGVGVAATTSFPSFATGTTTTNFFTSTIGSAATPGSLTTTTTTTITTISPSAPVSP